MSLGEQHRPPREEEEEERHEMRQHESRTKVVRGINAGDEEKESGKET